MVEIEEKIRDLLSRLQKYYSALLDSTFSGGKGRIDLLEAHFYLRLCFYKIFNRREPGIEVVEKYRIYPGDAKGRKMFFERVIRDFYVIIKEIETIHLKMGEQGCNFWSFIALEQAWTKVTIAQDRFAGIAESLPAGGLENVHPNDQRATHETRI